MINKPPPNDIKLEQTIISSLMMGRKYILRSLNILKREYFFDERHIHIYDAINNLFSKDINADVETVHPELASMGKLEDVQIGYLLSCNAVGSGITPIEYLCMNLMELYLRRELIKKTRVAESKAFDLAEPINEVLPELQSEIINLSSGFQRNTQYDADRLINKWQEKQEKIIEGKYNPVKIYLKAVRSTLGYFYETDLYILAGRPSNGKTALGLNLADEMISVQDIPIGIISLDMAAAALFNRLIAINTGIDGNIIKSGKLTKEQLHRIGEYFKRFKNRKLFIEDQSGLNIMQIFTIAQRWKDLYGIRALFIDYLQLIRVQGKSNGQEADVAFISQMLKNIAKSLEIPVIALAQLNRGSTTNKFMRPTIVNLRNSGAIEQDADTIIFTHYPKAMQLYKFEDGSPTDGIIEIITGKQRDGSIGIYRTAFNEKLTKFTDLQMTDKNSIANYERKDGKSIEGIKHFQDTDKDDEVPF